MITVYIDLFKIPQVGIEISTVVSTHEALEWGHPFISSLDNNLLHGYFFQEHYLIFKTTEVTSSQEKKAYFHSGRETHLPCSWQEECQSMRSLNCPYSSFYRPETH